MPARRTPTSRSAAIKGSRRARRSKTPDSDRRNDRPYVIILFGLLVVIGAMAIGPLRSLAAANDRVDELTHERDVLAEEVEDLEQRRADLNDPAEQEVYAREQLGMVRPGEIPYVVLPDGEDATAAGKQGGAGAGTEDNVGTELSWYRRLAAAVSSLFGG